MPDSVKEKERTAHRTPEEFLRRKKNLEKKRGNFPTLWQEIAEHILPDRAEFLTRSQPGERRGGTIFDTTAIDANIILAAGLHTQMTSPSMDWFSIGPRRQALKDVWAVKRWFETCDRIMTASYAQSAFYNAMSEFYLDMGSLGTAPMFIDNILAPFRMIFNPFSCRDALMSENQFGIIDTMYRPFEWTLRQCAMEWGEEKLSRNYRTMLRDGKEDEIVPLLHATEPRPNRQRDSELSAQMPWASVYLEEKTGHIIEVGGYITFPFVVGRFYKWGAEAYGRSPGMLALPDIRTADNQDETNLRAGHKSVEPPLNVPHDMKGKVRTSPNALNYMGKSGGQLTPVDTGIRGIPYSVDLQERKQRKIEEKFFKNIFLMLDQSGNVYKNIPEIMAREQEKMTVLGPMIGRLMHEVLGPCIERSFMLHLMNGMFPPPPPILEGEEIEIEYISPLARTMKQLEGSSVTQAMTLSMPIFDAKPESIDLINGDEWVRWAFDLHGAPGRIMNSPEQVEEIRAQRAQQIQEQQEKDELMMAAQGVKTVAEADRATGNKLSEAFMGEG
jgi:hypothetical protein